MLNITSRSFLEAKGSKLYMDSMYINKDYTPVTAIKLDSFRMINFPQKKSVSVVGSKISKRYKNYCLKIVKGCPPKLNDFKNKNSEVRPTYFKVGDFVDIQSNSKGKGFQGVIKRWGFSKQPKTHGSMSHRRGGSYGNREWPAEIQKGKKMPGQLGNTKITVQNLLIVSTVLYKNMIIVKGSIPGSKKTPFRVFFSKKKYLSAY